MSSLIGGLLSRSRSAAMAEGYDPLKARIPLRTNNEPDEYDDDRIQAVLRDYNRQTDVLTIADRQIEYNVRMVCNQQWNYFDGANGQYIDVAQWFTAEEQKWRQLPTINEELRWFQNIHSRLTENPPILTWLPGPDQVDAQLAETLDTLAKHDWRSAQMPSLWPEVVMWVLIAGRGHCVSHLDLTKGAWRPWTGRARIPLWDGRSMDQEGKPAPLVGPDGEPVLTEQEIPEVPIKHDGKPNAVMAPNGEVLVTGKGHMERSGGVGNYVPSPLQVRGEWGPQPWHQKRWHSVMRFMSPEEVWANWQVEVEPDVNVEGAANVNILERVLYGAGFYGTSRGLTGGSGYPGADVKGPLCTIIERWDAPLGFDPRLLGTWAEPMMETPDFPENPETGEPAVQGNPGGRHQVVSPNTVIIDGPREARWPFTSPIRTWDLIRVPGRPRGMTNLETLHSPQRTLNKMTHLAQEGVGLNAAPQRVLFEGFGIELDDVNNAPNKVYQATGVPSEHPPIQFLTPPPMNPDLWRLMGVMRDNLTRLGGLDGTEGAPPAPDASGEAIKEIRFNSDRDLGDFARRSAEEFGRQAEDYRALYPLIYTMPQVITITGDENAATTIAVYPELFAEGNVRVQADAESMLPEGRGERQARAAWMWKNGAFGDPRDPAAWSKATDTFLTISRFPSYSKLARPGGVDRETAEIENGRLMMGAPGQPVLPWYDDAVHLMYHEKFMKSVAFLKAPKPVQMAFEYHRMQHIMQLQNKMAQMAPAPGGPAGAGGPAPGGHQPPPDGQSGPGGQQGTDHGAAAQPNSRGGAQGRGPLSNSHPAQ